jgi:uncharacterized protein YyaL (SSP411 family)
MLYDNSQLTRVYLHAWQVTGYEFFRTITEEILDYVMREMLYVGAGANDRQFRRMPKLQSKAYGLAKVLTSWNGLMLAAFAEAARFLDRGDGSRALAASYRLVAERNADFLLRELRQENGRLLRTWKSNPELSGGPGEAKLNGYLEDYSYLVEGPLELYQTTFDPQCFVAAQELAETMIAHFQAAEGVQLARSGQLPSNATDKVGGIAGFYDTSDDHETLITRPRDLQDNATPSGNAMAVTALLKLAGFTNDLRYVDMAHHSLAQMQTPTGRGMMSQYPLGFGQWLQALEYAFSKPREIAIVGDPDSADTQALLSVVRDGYRPLQVVALGAPGAQSPSVPLLQNRGQLDGQGTVYVCRDFACQAPITDPAVLQSQLEARRWNSSAPTTQTQVTKNRDSLPTECGLPLNHRRSLSFFDSAWLCAIISIVGPHRTTEWR